MQLRARPMWWILIAVVLLYALVCVVIATQQARLVWYPGSRPSITPAEQGLAYAEVELDTADGVRIHGWHVRCAGRARALVIVSHGNAGNVEHRIPIARAFTQMGCDTLLYDYRGYGKSGGTPTEEGTYLDAEAAYAWARSAGFEPLHIVAFGESLGGAITIELAKRKTLGAVIVEDTFTSLADMGRKFYPWLPVALVLRIRYDSIAKIGALQAPVMVIHSREDDLVPFELGERLFAAAPEPKRFLETLGAHNAGGFTQRPAWCAEVNTFLGGALTPR